MKALNFIRKYWDNSVGSWNPCIQFSALNTLLKSSQLIQNLSPEIAKRKYYHYHLLVTGAASYDGSDNLLMRFDYADDRMPYAVTMEGVTYYLTYDQMGSLRAVSDSAGNVVKLVEYDSFGNIVSETAPSFLIPFGFAGGLHDRDTSIVRFGYREYDPDIGRWTAKDPIGFAGGDTDLYGLAIQAAWRPAGIGEYHSANKVF